tara:strand:- start:465 stop:770 length:306 start_codon:yes stop_codon:yes gene_type:complete
MKRLLLIFIFSYIFLTSAKAVAPWLILEGVGLAFQGLKKSTEKVGEFNEKRKYKKKQKIKKEEISSNTSIQIKELEKLTRLLENGSISKEEFLSKKKKILN